MERVTVNLGEQVVRVTVNLEGEVQSVKVIDGLLHVKVGGVSVGRVDTLNAVAGTNVTLASTKAGNQVNLTINSAEDLSTLELKAIAATGTVIDFTQPKIFNEVTPATGNITDDLTGARIGVVQKIYHNHSDAPTYPAGWVKKGTGEYATSTLNLIFAEWKSGTAVEYWIVP